MFKILILILFSKIFLISNAFAYLCIDPLIPLIGQGIYLFWNYCYFFWYYFLSNKIIIQKKRKTKIEKKDK